ncbi:toprim domain-containing protein [Mesorhizobium sp. KR9-304]|uniref:toprim domain-containing protein n=1 Tax=Mesorhizobium sp. KR9-304 TaxID=3156614 RepID=UPI0032B558E6
MLREPLRERARGRWHSILPAIGVPSKALRNRHGPCPVCGGKDRFRFDDKAGTGSFFCSQCGPGDGIELVKRLHRLDFRQTAALIEQHLGEAPARQPQTGGGSNDGHRLEELKALWSRSRPITLDDPAGRYLNDRTGITQFPACLRFSSDERYADPGTKPSWHPLLLARFEPADDANAEGPGFALHRTYLDAAGRKADMPSPRKMLGAMPAGGAVRLMPHGDTLGIAEGIETALSASALFNVPVWAALTSGLLQDWNPPNEVRLVIVFGDTDASFTGQSAAYLLARRLKARGLIVSVELPLRTGSDWNDVLLEARKRAS